MESKSFETEMWVNAIGYSNYKISSYGRLLSIKSNKILRPVKCGKYLAYTVTHRNPRKREYAHRMVALAFLGSQPSNKHNINHIDGDKYNNKLENIEWVTQSENTIHAYKLGLMVSPRASLGKFGADHHRSKRVFQFNLDGSLIASFGSMKEAERKTGFFSSAISKCINYKSNTRTAFGYIWSFNEEVEPNINAKYLRRKIVKMDLDGNFICKYNSATAAAKDNNINTSGLIFAIKNNSKTRRGYIWRYETN